MVKLERSEKKALRQAGKQAMCVRLFVCVSICDVSALMKELKAKNLRKKSFSVVRFMVFEQTSKQRSEIEGE